MAKKAKGSSTTATKTKTTKTGLKQQSKKKAKTTKTGSKQQSKKKATIAAPHSNRKSARPKKVKVPTSLVCPETGETVVVANATLKDIKDANKIKRPPWLKSKQYLVTVPSPAVRHDIYDRTAGALADLETKLLPTYGGRSWQVTVSIHDPNDAKSPFFVWTNRGLLELASLPNIIAEKIPNPPRFPGFANTDTKKNSTNNNTNNKKKQQQQKDQVMDSNFEQADEENESKDDTTKNYNKDQNKEVLDSDENEGRNESEVQVEEEEEDEEEEEEEEEVVEEVLSEEQLYWKELQEREIDNISTLAYNERSIVPLPVITVKWTSPLLETFRTRSSAYEHAKILCKHEVFIDRHLHGFTANGISIQTASVLSKPPTKSAAMKVGKFRFERDGIWIIGQEQSWQIPRIQESIQQHEQEQGNDNQADKTSTTKSKKESMPPVSATTTTTPLQSSSLSFNLITANNESNTRQDDTSCSSDNEVSSATMNSEATTTVVPTGNKSGYVTPSPTPQQNHPSSDIVNTSPNEEGEDKSELNHDTNKAVKKTLFEKRPQQVSSSKSLSFTPTYRTFCLSEEQIRLCYDAGLDHYDQIMRTVTARDLTEELRDGFDLLRERGRGRFDMELPVFESDPSFKFLTCLKKAPWMPVVRQLLGDDVVLIHKGMFLSMPGSEKQEYHQDGLHLTRQCQRPCHAINVFIPLVDLTSKNGPTEFCLGSHILGNERFNEDFVITPQVPAGCPIIFDYRLGHRGLANSSTSCRPVVYCTYAPVSTNNKEFKDSVNFSRKRYHKIGDLITEAPPSRDERALKRQRTTDEHLINKVIKESTSSMTEN